MIFFCRCVLDRNQKNPRCFFYKHTFNFHETISQDFVEEAPETWGDCYTEAPVPGEGVWGLGVVPLAGCAWMSRDGSDRIQW